MTAAPDARAAVAVWVKTPGRSPVKTRLAAAIGRAEAEAFYARAVRAVEAVVRAAGGAAGGALAPYWAVAEPGAEAEWRGFATVAQGEGGLGERQARVYDALRARHARVLLIGTDSPHLRPDALADAARRLAPGGRAGEEAGADFVVGPAADGGYYLFGGRRPLPARVWTEVPYSAPGTLAALRPRPARHGVVAELATTFDVDTVDDLTQLGDALAADAAALLPAQGELLAWTRGRGAARP